MKQLRDYQQEAQTTVYSKLKAGVKKQMVVLPTGMGKSLFSVRTINAPEFNNKLWITHTEELLDQSGGAMLQELFPKIDISAMIDTYGGLSEYVRYVQKNPLFSDTPEAQIMKSVNVIKADLFGLNGEFTIASAQTLHRRLDRIPQDHFDAIVADEVHLFGAATFVKSLNYFNPKLLLGITATPHRQDGVLLGDIFDEIVYQYPLEKAIAQGYLCELNALRIKTSLNLDAVRTTAGELNQKDLKETVNTLERNNLIVQKYKQYAEGKQNIVFCVDVEHAMDVCETFQNAGYSAEFVVGDENLCPDRKGVIRRFKEGKTQILTNVMICTAGFDHPYIGCVTLACPTKSLTKYMQQLGRGTRTLPGVINGLNTPEERLAAIAASDKPNCVILDIVDTTTRHRLINTFELDREKPVEERVFMTKQMKLQLIDARIKRQASFVANTKQDTRINLLALPKVKISTSMKMKEPASDKQLMLLQKLGYEVETMSYTKEMATQLISNSQASDKQIKFLRWKGFDVSNGVTVGEAQAAFEMIKKKEAEEALKKQAQTDSPISDIF